MVNLNFVFELTYITCFFFKLDLEASISNQEALMKSTSLLISTLGPVKC